MPSDMRWADRANRDGGLRRLHPLTVAFATLGEAQALVIPALLGGAWAGGGHMGRMAGWMLALLVIPSVLWAVAEYRAFGYGLVDGGLVLDRGVLRRHHRVIPFSRVQSIDVRQGALQRLVGVAEVHVATAGGEATEAVLSVLALREAEALRTELLSRRDVAAAKSQATSHAASAVELAVGPAVDQPAVLARLSTRDLVLAGATSNEAGLIAALLVGAVELAYQFDVPVPLPALDVRALLTERPVAELVRAVALLGIAALVLAWLFSIAGALLRYHGFVLSRTGGELQKRYGALHRETTSIPLERVQAARVEESLLRRPLGLVALKIETAGTAPGTGHNRGVEAYLPLASARDVPRLVAAVFDGLDYGALRFRPVHPHAWRRAFIRYSAPVLTTAVALAIALGPGWLWVLTLVPLALVAAHVHVRHLGYAVAPGYVALRAGFVTRTTWIVPQRRVQTLHVRETVFQRRLGLATLGVDTAAGEATAPDLGVAEAHALLAQLGGRTGTSPNTDGRGPSVAE